jgi:hypothetical protein
MVRKAIVWLPAVLALCAPLASMAQEGDPHTLQAIHDAHRGLKAQWMDGFSWTVDGTEGAVWASWPH